MTNAEVLIHDLQKINENEVAECVADYIACPSSDDCKYDGADSTPCTNCKVKWLKAEWKD
ncbi:MAG: hypothetical protein ACK5MV_12620 [Aminipila sp.]